MLLGLLLSFTISPAMTARIGIENGYHFTIHHIIFCLFGFAVMLFCSMLSKEAILSFSFFGYFFCFCCLFAVLIIGGTTKGSHRWIDLGFFLLQPAELMKPFFVVFNAYLLAYFKNRSFGLLACLSSSGLLLFLLILQPDFGSTIVFSLVLSMQLLFAGLRFKILFWGLFIFGLLILVVGFIFFPHFHYRIVNFLHFSSGGEHYQTRKAIESIHNGGFFGTSLGEGKVKYQLPDAHTDYIFSVLCEELGAIFILLLFVCILAFFFRHLISNIFANRYDLLVIYGTLMFFLIQSFVHIGVNLNLLPSKGMTFPFLSYGGSSMISSSIIFGFLLAFTRKPYRLNSPYKFF